MPHVSKNKLNKNAEKEVLTNLKLVLSHIGNNESMELFLDSLLTPTEKIMLAKRLAIIVLVKEGLTDTEISSSLNVTRITVSKIRYFYEARGKGFDVAIDKLKQLERLDAFKKLLLSLTKYSIRAAGGYIKPNILD